ncbi:retention module-containing protein, partial [Halomonas sp. LR5S13]|uniref:retention module-containing protein n=1 Tax=Halomonas rhizosphaerae TaxID=3043296 RepID=UPI0024A7A875
MTIATIISISGQAWARDEAGNLRELRVGDTLQEGETLVTSDNGRVELDFADDLDPTVIEGGQEVVMTPDLDAEQPVAAEEASAQDEDLEALLSAIDEGEGDLLEGLDATAAGAGGAGGEGGGHDFVRLARITENVNPLAFEYGLASLDGTPEIEGQAVEALALEDEPDSFPTVDTIDLDGDGDTVWESALPEGSGGGTLTTSGTLQIDTGTDLLALIEVRDAEGNWIAVGAEGSTIVGEYGTLTVNPDGSWSYTLAQSIDHPAQGETGEADQLADTFAVRVTDDDGDVSDPATLTIHVNDDGPVASGDAVGEIAEDGSVDIDVFANDTAGADGVDLQSGVAVATAPTQGTVTYNGDGTFTYTANPGAEGSDSFSYTLTDADGDTATATVTLSIAADSTPTVTVADASVDETGGLESDTQAFTTTYGSDSAGTLALSAAGATWDAATSTLAADNGDWQIVVNDDGTYTVTQLQAMTHPDASDPNDAVVVTVTADITDNEGDPAQDTFTVTFLDDGPVAADDTVTDEVDEDGSVDIDVFANDTAGADGVDLQSGVAVATAPTQGTVTYNGDGTFTYTANPGA